MTLQQLKYALTIADCGSMNEAAKQLFISQPSLSETMKELETEIGLDIFLRSNRGIVITPEGEEFLGYARQVTEQFGLLQSKYIDKKVKEKFSVSTQHYTFAVKAFVETVKQIGMEQYEFAVHETTTISVIENVKNFKSEIGVLYENDFNEKVLNKMFKENGLEFVELFSCDTFVYLWSGHPLAKQDEVHFDDLKPYIEIAHADPYVPSLPLSVVKKEELPDETERRIFVFERASQFDLMAENHETYMWLSPVPQKLKDRYGLVEKNCPDNKKTYRDLLIYRKDYHLSDLDRRFITELCLAKRQYI